MPVELVKVPSPGESVSEGRIAKWYAADGAAVKVDDPLFELESDKAAQTVTAQTAGVLKIKVKEGEVVPIGAVVAEIDPAGAPAPAGKTPAPPAAPAKPIDRPAELIASPSAQRVIAERGLDIDQITGSGPRGLITKEDAAGFQKPGIGDRLA